MSRWYKVVFTDGISGYKSFVSSGNTRHSAEQTSRRKLLDEVGAAHGKWWTSKIVPVKVSPETGRPEGM